MIQKQYRQEIDRMVADGPGPDDDGLFDDYFTFDGKKLRINWWNILLRIGPFVARVAWAFVKPRLEQKAKNDANGDIWY